MECLLEYYIEAESFMKEELGKILHEIGLICLHHVKHVPGCIMAEQYIVESKLS